MRGCPIQAHEEIKSENASLAGELRRLQRGTLLNEWKLLLCFSACLLAYEYVLVLRLAAVHQEMESSVKSWQQKCELMEEKLSVQRQTHSSEISALKAKVLDFSLFRSAHTSTCMHVLLCLLTLCSVHCCGRDLIFPCP